MDADGEQRSSRSCSSWRSPLIGIVTPAAAAASNSLYRSAGLIERSAKLAISTWVKWSSEPTWAVCNGERQHKVVRARSDGAGARAVTRVQSASAKERTARSWRRRHGRRRGGAGHRSGPRLRAFHAGTRAACRQLPAGRHAHPHVELAAHSRRVLLPHIHRVRYLFYYFCLTSNLVLHAKM